MITLRRGAALTASGLPLGPALGEADGLATGRVRPTGGLEGHRPSQARRLTSDNAKRDLPPMRRAAMLEKENSLPGAELHPAVQDRDHLA